MATVYQDTVAHSGLHPAQGLGAWIARRFANITASRRRAREIHILAQFSDRDLWDVGLSRSDLMALEKGVYRRD